MTVQMTSRRHPPSPFLCLLSRRILDPALDSGKGSLALLGLLLGQCLKVTFTQGSRPRAFFVCLSLLVSGNVEVHCLAWSHSEWTEEGQKRGDNEGCRVMMDRSMAPGQGMEFHLSASVSLSVKWGL